MEKLIKELEIGNYFMNSDRSTVYVKTPSVKIDEDISFTPINAVDLKNGKYYIGYLMKMKLLPL